MSEESETELDQLEKMRERLRRHADALEDGTAEIIKLQPDMTVADLAETVRDRIAMITAALNRNGRS